MYSVKFDDYVYIYTCLYIFLCDVLLHAFGNKIHWKHFKEIEWFITQPGKRSSIHFLHTKSIRTI